MLTPLYSRLGNDPDLSDLVEMFVEGMADRIARLEDACARRDWTNLRKTAHQLKGSAGGYGFDTITDSAGTLELALKDSPAAEEVEPLLAALCELCRRAATGSPPLAAS